MKILSRKTIVTSIAAASMVVGMAETASAGAKAYSHLLIDNFIITNSVGTQYDAADFSALNIGNNSSTSAGTTNNGSLPLNTQLDQTAGGGNADDNLSCVGSGCGVTILEDDYTQQPAPAGSFARGDTQLLGALITGLPFGQDFVTADALAEGQTSVTDDGEGNSSVGTLTDFTFNLASDDSITFAFDATPFMEALLHQDDVDAFASMNFSISIREDGVVLPVYSFSPGSINLSIGQLDEGSTVYNPGTLMFSDTTGILTAGTDYTLTIDHRARATFDAIKVPEPATLGLMGLGLLGMGVATRKQKSKAKAA